MAPVRIPVRQWKINVPAGKACDPSAASGRDSAGAGGQATGGATDVTKLADVRKLVDTAKETYGRVDVIFNNAGLMPLSPLDSLRIDEWDRMIDVNMKGTLYGIAAALPYMKAQKSGHVINVSSVYGHKVVATGAVYCATKHAVRAISEGLRQEVKDYNIRVTTLSPGAVRTELTDHITEPGLAEGVSDVVAKIGVPASTMARMVAFAISQPDDVDVNEILFRPTIQPT